MPERTLQKHETRNTRHETSDSLSAYNVQLEIDEYRRLSRLEGKIPPGEYAAKLLAWKQEKFFNQQTNLGERFNTQLFEVEYPVIGGRLINPFRDEPMLESLVTGQQERLSGRQNQDDKRELAEIVTFSAVESYFAENSGTLVVPSPSGGSFSGNFIDVFTSFKKEDRSFVRMQRYPTDRTLSQHWQIAQSLTREPLGEQAQQEQDVQIKGLVIQTNLSIDQLRKAYTPDKNATPVAEYQKLVGAMTRGINNYINSIIINKPAWEIEENHNATIKSADIFMGKDIDITGLITRDFFLQEYNPAQAAAILGQQETKVVKTGCGIQGGLGKRDLVSSTLFDKLNKDPFSSDEEDKGDFPCPKCGYIITYGAGIKQCPGCGLEATCE